MELRTFQSYEDLKKVHSDDISAFPILWLFGKHSEEDLKEKLSTIGATSLQDCCSVYGGGIIHTAKKQEFLNMLQQHAEERTMFMNASTQHLVSVIRREMANHEYAYTRDYTDTLAALGKTTKDLENDATFRKAWYIAEKECISWYESHCV